MTGRPADECPYTRPFPNDFAACPAYQPRLFIPLDTGFRPLQPTWTCRHLEARAASKRTGGFYAGCIVGDVADRERWAEQVKTDRLAAIAGLRQTLAHLTVPYLQRLWSIKARQLQALVASEDPAAPTQEMEQVGRELQIAMEAILREQEAVLRRIELPLEACLDLLRDWLKTWIAEPSTKSSLEVPDDLLGRLPEDLQVFFRPQSQTRQPAPSPAA